jgi:hypothetical protein
MTPSSQIGLPAVAAAQLLDRSDHQLALLGAALLALCVAQWASCLGHE